MHDPRTTTPIWLAVAAMTMALVLARRRSPGGAARRLTRVLRRPSAGPGPVTGSRPGANAEIGQQSAATFSPSVLVAAVLWWAFGPVLAAVGLVVAWGFGHYLRRRGSAPARARRARLVAEAPMAAELIAACLLAGCDPTRAAELVSRAVGGPVGERLAEIGALLRLGAAPSAAWRRLCAEPALAALGRTMARAVDSGALLAETVSALADDQRAAARAVAEARVREVGVRAVGPLGLCFLPAFVLLGVVPLVVSLAGPLLVG